MRIRVVLVAAALMACGGDEAIAPAVRDSGVDASAAYVERDAGHDAGRPDTGAEQSGTGGDEPVAGSGGQPTGGMAAGGSGGSVDPELPPEGGAGAGGQGGQQAPQERVLWSQEWTVAVHSAAAYGAAEGDAMGLFLDAGQGCKFGQQGAASGTSQDFETDGQCITAFSAPAGAASFFSASGMQGVSAGRADLVGWDEAVEGKTVLFLRRTQTYTMQLLGSGNQRWNYADFTGRWEAWGY